MSNYTYADGAIHNDHHKEMTINVSGKTDIAALMKAFMADDAEVVEEVREETKEASSSQTLEEIKQLLVKADEKLNHFFKTSN